MCGQHRIPLAQFFGVFRILRSIDERNWTPGIPFAPLEYLVPRLQTEVGTGSQRDKALQKFSPFLPARKLVLNERIGLEKNREDILLVAPLKTKPEIILLEGFSAA